MFGKSVGVITTNQFRFDNFALVVKTGSLGELWQRCLIRLQGWEIIFVSAMSPISCGTTLQNKQLKDVERLSPLSFFLKSWTGSRVVGPSNRHAQHPRPPFQIWQACGGCSSSPWVSEGCWNSDSACNEHRQKAKSWRLSHPGMNYENIDDLGCFLASLWPFAAATHSNALCFSDTQWQQLRQWWVSKMSLNHVEPFHFATQLLTAWKDLVQTLHLPRQSLQTAARLQIPPPAESKAQGIQRYCMQNLNVSICFTCTRWHIAVSGSFMFSWNYWLMMGMSYEQNTMGKGPNLSPWGLVNKRPRQKMWERRRHRKPWALAMRREMRRATWRKAAKWSERGGVEWLSGKELGGSLEEMNPYQSVHDKLRVWQLDCSTSLAKARKKHEKNQACYH